MRACTTALNLFAFRLMLRFPGSSLDHRDFIDPGLRSSVAVLARTNQMTAHRWAAITWIFPIRTAGSKIFKAMLLARTLPG